MYVSLHNRSAYSFGSALTMPAELAAFAHHEQMPAIALTDRHGLYAAVEFQQCCEHLDIKPIFGAELDVTMWHDPYERRQSPRNSRSTKIQADPLEKTPTPTAVLLAENEAGYANLCRLVSLRQLQDEPLTAAQLCEHAAGLITLLAPPGQPQQRTATVNLLATLREAFTERLFVSLSLHQRADLPIARRLAGWADEWKLPVVATCASRCPRRDQMLTLRALASIGTLTLLDQPHPDKPLGTYHLRSAKEMAHLFARRPDALTNTLAVAERCHFKLDLTRSRFPGFDSPDGRTALEHLRALGLAGCRRRYVEEPPLRNIGGYRPTLAEAIARLERELAIIEQVHYAEYFLVFHEIVEHCRAEGIATLARGSAADSLLCYVLGISHACPFRFDLPFDRFVNPERAKFSKMADIDLDLPWDKREQVIRWVYDRWGHDRVAMIGCPHVYHGRAAVAELGKVFGLPPHEVYRVTKLLPRTRATRLQQAVAGSPEARDLPLAEEPYRTILSLAGGLEGIPRHWAMHPCGLVVSPEPLTDLVPVQSSPRNLLVAQYEMDAVEELGFVKIDLLGQAGLSVLRDAVAEIERTDSRTIDLTHDVDFQDEAIWDMIACGQARGVHHIESPAMTSLIKQCNVRDIDCLTSIVAIIRPGAANQGKKDVFARRYQGFEPSQYAHPSLEPVLEKTYGLMVFEEHILQIAVAFAGMNLGRADVLRRALNKENDRLIAELRGEFLHDARRLGRGEAEITAVWELVEGFAGFMFNKAHSAEYAVEAFQGAWLKRHWPAHYIAAILSNYRGFYAHSPTLPQILYVLEALRLGARFLPPCVNESEERFAVSYSGTHDAITEYGTDEPSETEEPSNAAASEAYLRADGSHLRGNKPLIRIPLSHIKGLSQTLIDRHLAERRQGCFTSLADFLRRCRPTDADAQRLLESGAFDGFGASRPALFWHLRRHLRQLDADAPLWLNQDLADDHPQEVVSTNHTGQTYNNEANSNSHASHPGKRMRQGGGVNPVDTSAADDQNDLPPIDLTAPDVWHVAAREMTHLGFPVTIDPLTYLSRDEHGRWIDWSRYTPVGQLDAEHHSFAGRTVRVCGLMVADRINRTTGGDLMKFVTLADRTGFVETQIFPDAYQRFGHLTATHPILAATAVVEPFENRNGYTLRITSIHPPVTRGRQSRTTAPPLRPPCNSE
jgi:DNA-directed DNA polymerase III PolC